MCIRRCLPNLVIAATTCLVAGCYERTENGDQSVYTYPIWLLALVAGGGLLALPAGWFLRRLKYDIAGLKKKLSVILMILGPVIAIVIVPAMSTDRVVVDSKHFEWHLHNVEFRHVNEMKYEAVEKPGRGMNRTYYYLHCKLKYGTTDTIEAG